MKICPKCKSNMIIDIIYGFPSDELINDASKNKVELGGCVIEPNNHKYKCKSCGNEFGHKLFGGGDDMYIWEDTYLDEE